LERNGVVEDELLKAVAWSPEPRVRKAVQDVARRSDDPGIVTACAPALGGVADEKDYEKLSQFLLRANKGYSYPSTGPCGLLKALARLFPDRCEPVFGQYLKAGGHESALNLVSFLSETRTDLAPRVLAPLLSDKGEGYGSYRKDGRSDLRYDDQACLPMRLCDNAFLLISSALGDKNARCKGTRQEMDLRIEVLRKRLPGVQ
jgi:hypothetical protein